MLKEILKNWNIPPVKAITSIRSGKTWFITTVSDESFVLKASELVYAEREYTFRTGLSMTKLPVAPPVCTVNGHWHFADRSTDNVYSLYPKLPGDVFSDHYTGDYVKKAECLGQAIGLLHTCFSELDNESSNCEMQLTHHIQEWVILIIRKGRKNSSIEEIWQEAKENLISLEQAAPIQLIHRDAHPSNILFDNGELTGFIDFELVTRGLRLFDVCYCASAILVGGFKDPEKEKQWFELFEALLQGYQLYQELTPLERTCVYEMLVAIELIFMAYWLTTDNLNEVCTLRNW